MNKFELFALNHYLQEWPDDMTFNDIVLGIEHGEIAYTVKFPYDEAKDVPEIEMRSFVAMSMLDMCLALMTAFEERQ